MAKKHWAQSRNLLKGLLRKHIGCQDSGQKGEVQSIWLRQGCLNSPPPLLTQLP